MLDEFEKHPEVHVDVIDPALLTLHLPGQGDDQSDAERIQALVENATGVIFATPEYHGSYSSVTKLVIDNLGFPSALSKPRRRYASVIRLSWQSAHSRCFWPQLRHLCGGESVTRSAPSGKPIKRRIHAGRVNIRSDLANLTTSATQFTIAPNGSETISLSLNLDTAGSFIGTLDIFSDDPDKPTLVLSISGTLQIISPESRADFNTDGKTAFIDFLSVFDLDASCL